MAVIIRFFDAVNRGLGCLVPVVDLAIRLWVANVFFKSGLTKIQSFEITVQLFQYEYEVPFTSPETAAYLGTAAELVLPVFLALGLLGRYAALALFVFNVVAVISYPALNEPGLRDHQVWGLMLLVTICYGPGSLSLDFLIEKLWLRRV